MDDQAASEGLLLRQCEQIDGETENARKDIEKNWNDNIKQVRGDQWRLKRNPYFLANVIKNQVNRKTGYLTEVKAQFKVSAIKPNLQQASSVIYNDARAILDRSNSEDAFYRLAKFGMTLGSGFLGAMYDPLEDDIEVAFYDPRRVYIDKWITSAADLDKAQYLRIDTVLPLADIRRRFPGRGQNVKPDEKFSTYSEKSRGRLSVANSVLSEMPYPYRPRGVGISGPIPRAEIREYWIRDPQLNTQGEPLFSGGRHVIRAGKTILIDEANPYWDGTWPLVMFEWDVDYDSPWGMDEIQDLKRLQEAINRMGDAWIRNLLLGSNFRIVADLDALEPDQWKELDNEAGLIIRKKPQRQFDYQAPVQDTGVIPNSFWEY